MPLYMVGRNTPPDENTDDQRIWWSVSDDGIFWAPMSEVPGANTPTTPSLASWKGRLYMAWRGVRASGVDDPALYWSVFDGSSWSSYQRFGDPDAIWRRSSFGPQLVARHDRLCMYWRGEKDGFGQPNKRVMVATFDGNTWSDGQSIMGGRAVSDIDIFVTDSNTSRVHLLAREGANNDNVLYWSQDGVSWNVNDRIILPHKSIGIPSLVGFPGFGTSTLMLTYIKNDNDQVYGSSSSDNGRTWSPEAPVTGVRSNHPPRYATWGSAQPFAVWRSPGHTYHQVFQARPATVREWWDPRTKRPTAPDSPPIDGLVSYHQPVIAAYGSMLFD
ncbi:hypothetical protein [Nocardia brasiliensis]|uniref:hypothetical protein n=1 Tax=Nocardia brasiliensis TaxID=37326 RepID=UPI00366C1357